MNNLKAEIVEIPIAKLEKVADDPVKSAKLFNLVYISGTEKGITRIKEGKDFHYLSEDKEIRNKKILSRIKKLVIPPAWQNVWICTKENGHLQATGIDIKGRKQYRYHPLWNKMRSETKYFRLYEFGKHLPSMREQLDKDVSQSGFPQKKILAAIVLLMERTSARIGNSFYEKLYGSFGLTTLRNRHAKVKGNTIQLTFKGKKGVQQAISLQSKRLARIIRKCHDLPGQELFQFLDENGNRHPVDSGMVNEYIHEITGADFTSKDFRTWSGTIAALIACNQPRQSDTQHTIRHNVTEVLDEVARHLGNTRNVCKKYYVHPLILELYETQRLEAYLQKHEADDESDKSGYSHEEKVLMNILKENFKDTKIIEVII